MDFFRELGKEAARRSTEKSQSIKVFKPGGRKAVRSALSTPSTDARQLPWHYGEKREQPVPADDQSNAG